MESDAVKDKLKDKVAWQPSSTRPWAGGKGVE